MIGLRSVFFNCKPEKIDHGLLNNKFQRGFYQAVNWLHKLHQNAGERAVSRSPGESRERKKGKEGKRWEVTSGLDSPRFLTDRRH